MKGIYKILKVATEFAKGFNTDFPTWLGYIGTGIFQDFVDASDGFGGSSQWAIYQLDQDLRQTDDYLSCLMTALINQAVYNIEHYISDQDLVKFNQQLQGMTSSITEHCGQLNCMTYMSEIRQHSSGAHRLHRPQLHTDRTLQAQHGFRGQLRYQGRVHQPCMCTRQGLERNSPNFMSGFKWHAGHLRR